MMFRCFLFGKFELVDMYCAYALLVCDVGVALRCENNFCFHLGLGFSNFIQLAEEKNECIFLKGLGS